MEAQTGKVAAISPEILEKVRNTLDKKGFRTVVLKSEKEVKDFINTNIPDEHIVGLGDSITTCKLNIRHILAAKGSTIFYGWNGAENYNRSLDTFESLPRPDYYLTRINALTVEGKILLKDYSKESARNQQIPPYVFAFAGLNRIVSAFNNTDSITKYPVFDEVPSGVAFTVALLPFLTY